MEGLVFSLCFGFGVCVILIGAVVAGALVDVAEAIRSLRK